MLESVSRWAGPVGWIALAGGEGVSVVRWYYGYQTSRQFGLGQVQLVGGLGGGLAGAWAGALIGGEIGTLITPGVGTAVGGFLGGVVGGLAGAFGGSSLAGSFMEYGFELSDRRQDEEYVDFLRHHYGSR